MIQLFIIYYCKTRMVAYVNGELSPTVRRRIAQYIDKYPACYVEYRKQRDMRSELTERLPVFGVPQGGQLQQLWHNIEGDAVQPANYVITLAQALRLTLVVLVLTWFATSIATRNAFGDELIIITPPTPDSALFVNQINNPNRTPQTVSPTFVAIATSVGFGVAIENNTEIIAQPTQGASYQNPYPTPKIGE